MLKILDGRDKLYQWDLNRKLEVIDDTVNHVDFANFETTNALVCEVREENGKRIVEVPNVLLQQAWPISAYECLPDYTRVETKFEVIPREKPNDYVYTPTAVRTWEEHDKKIAILQNMLSTYANEKFFFQQNDCVKIPLYRDTPNSPIVAYWNFGGKTITKMRLGEMQLLIGTNYADRINQEVGKLTYTGEKTKYEITKPDWGEPHFIASMYGDDIFDKVFGQGFSAFFKQQCHLFGLCDRYNVGDIIINHQLFSEKNVATVKFFITLDENKNPVLSLLIFKEDMLKPEKIVYNADTLKVPAFSLYPTK